ncbi:MAG: LolA family protein [Victivallaceae bacterium]
MRLKTWSIVSLLSIFCSVSFASESLDEIHRNMQQMNTFSAQFTQVKNFNILSKPLLLRGRLFIRRVPFKLAWHIESPLRCSVIMDMEELRQWNEDSEDISVIRMADNPVLKTVSDSYRTMLTGDFSSFSTTCKQELDKTTRILSLTPLPGSQMGQFIKAIRFRFAEDYQYLNQIEIIEVNNNSTLINFNNASVNKVLPDNAWSIGK